MPKEAALAWRDCAEGGDLGLEGLCAMKRPWPGGTAHKEAALAWKDLRQEAVLAWRECAQGSGLGLEGLKEITRSLRQNIRDPQCTVL